MDLNYLYHRQQVSTFRAVNAACAASREAHRAFAQLYSLRIAEAKTPARIEGAA